MSETGAVATQQITIQDWLATIPAPFDEGHTLTGNQASAMNQLYAENVRNNFAKKVKDAREEAKKAGTEVDFNALQAALDTYAASYEFGTRKGGGGGDASLPKEPILRAAHIIARNLIRDKAKQKGKKLSAEQVASLVPKLLEKNPGIMDEARRQVEAQNSITIEELELPEEEEAEETEASGEGEAPTPAEEEGAEAPKGKRRGKK